LENPLKKLTEIPIVRFDHEGNNLGKCQVVPVIPMRPIGADHAIFDNELVQWFWIDQFNQRFNYNGIIEPKHK